MKAKGMPWNLGSRVNNATPSPKKHTAHRPRNSLTPPKNPKQPTHEAALLKDDSKSDVEKLTDFAAELQDGNLVKIFERFQMHAKRIKFKDGYDGVDVVQMIAEKLPKYIETKDKAALLSVIEFYCQLKEHVVDECEYHYLGLTISECLLNEFKLTFENDLRGDVAEHMLDNMIAELIGADETKIKNYKQQPHLINCVVFTFAHQQLVQDRTDISAFTRIFDLLSRCAQSNPKFWEGLLKLFVQFVNNKTQQAELLAQLGGTLLLAGSSADDGSKDSADAVQIDLGETPEIRSYTDKLQAWIEKPEDSARLTALLIGHQSLDSNNPDVISAMKMVADQINYRLNDIKVSEFAIVQFLRTVSDQIRQANTLDEESQLFAEQLRYYELMSFIANQYLVLQHGDQKLAAALAENTEFFKDALEVNTAIWGAVVEAYGSMIYDPNLRREFTEQFPAIFTRKSRDPFTTPSSNKSAGKEPASSPSPKDKTTPKRSSSKGGLKAVELVSLDSGELEHSDEDSGAPLLKSKSKGAQAYLDQHFPKRDEFRRAAYNMIRFNNRQAVKGTDELENKLNVLKQAKLIVDGVQMEDQAKQDAIKNLLEMRDEYHNSASKLGKRIGVILAVISAIILLTGIVCLGLAFAPQVTAQLPTMITSTVGAYSTNTVANAGIILASVGFLGTVGGAVIARNNSSTPPARCIDQVLRKHNEALLVL